MRRRFLARQERTPDAHVQPNPAIQPYAVDRLSRCLDHLRRYVDGFDLEDEIPGPERLVSLAHLEDIVDERGNRASAQLLPLADHLLEAREEDLAPLLVGCIEEHWRPAAAQHDPVRRVEGHRVPAVRHPRTLARPRRRFNGCRNDGTSSTIVAPVTIRYLSEGSAEQFAPAPREAVALATDALRAIARDSAVLGHCVLRPHERLAFGSMAGVILEPRRAGVKWVAESRGAGVTGTILLNDTETGRLTGIVGATFLTGLRTAAVSGACIQALGGDGPVAVVGTGLQARSHLRVLDALGRRDVRIAYRRRESADSIVAWAREHVPALRLAPVDNIRAAVADAAVVITMVTYGSSAPIDSTWLRADALVLPVDLAHCVRADIATTADLIAADDPANYEHMRQGDVLSGYPPAHMATGAALDAERPTGRLVIQNLGNAAGDLVLATATLDAAVAAGAATELAS